MRRALFVDDEAESLGPTSRDPYGKRTASDTCCGGGGHNHIASVPENAFVYMLSNLNGICSTMCSNSHHHNGTPAWFEVPTYELGHVQSMRVFFFGRANSSGPMTILLTGGRPKKRNGPLLFSSSVPKPTLELVSRKLAHPNHTNLRPLFHC